MYINYVFMKSKLKKSQNILFCIIQIKRIIYQLNHDGLSNM